MTANSADNTSPSRAHEPGSPTPIGLRSAELSLEHLANSNPDLAQRLDGLFAAIATEAGRTPRFARELQSALARSTASEARPSKPSRGEAAGRRNDKPIPTARHGRAGRRSPGPFDPFSVYLQGGVDGLRAQLNQLDLEQLRDIVAEHGMDHDRLAMKWKDSDRVITRIVDKVSSRSAKGSAFRPVID